MQLVVFLLAISVSVACAADVCSEHRSCGGCASVAGCEWCGLYAATEYDISRYQGFGFCQTAAARCHEKDPIFNNLYHLFNGSWRSHAGTIAKSKVTAKKMKTDADCPLYDPLLDKNVFDPTKQTCVACVGGNSGRPGEPVWVNAAVFAHGANGAENQHRGGYCIDSYHDSKWPVMYPLTNREEHLYAVGAFLQEGRDCFEEVPDCDMQRMANGCERVIGIHKCCDWHHFYLQFNETETETEAFQVYGGNCNELAVNPIGSFYKRTGLKPLVTTAFGHNNKKPVLVGSTAGNLEAHDELIFQYGLETCEKCLRYREEDTKWCHSTMSSIKRSRTAEGGVCMTAASEACGNLDGQLNDELTINSVVMHNCDSLPSTYPRGKKSAVQAK